MTVTHDLTQSSNQFQTFWLDLPVDAQDADTNAQFYAWLELGFDDFGVYGDLNGYQRAKWNAAYNQALKTEAVKLAYKADELKWLVKHDADFDVFPFSWTPHVDGPDIKVTVQDKNLAMLFKLTLGGD